MLADLFVAAAMARLIRIRRADVYSRCEMNPALKHHAGIMAKKSSNSGNCPSLWNI
jgi:hypothetical protein